MSVYLGMYFQYGAEFGSDAMIAQGGSPVPNSCHHTHQYPEKIQV
jgi:hypothetical protein